MPMQPYKGEVVGKPVTLACVHWRTFPPLEALRAGDSEALWRQGDIDDRNFQRFQVWERECGLTQMDDAKCKKCKHVRYLEIRQAHAPVLVTLDGKLRTPITDQTMLASLFKHRGNINTRNRPAGSRHSGQNAAWVAVANKEKPDG